MIPQPPHDVDETLGLGEPLLPRPDRGARCWALLCTRCDRLWFSEPWSMCPLCDDAATSRPRRPASPDPVGIGEVVVARPDHGPGWFTLACPACRATWVGRPDERCQYCQLVHEAIAAERIRELSNPDLPSREDATYDDAVAAWGALLAEAAVAGLISRRRLRELYSGRRSA